MTPPFRKVLVANRGEIALRVMRTLRKLGVESVAVYSDVDRQAPHVFYAEQALPLGGVTSAESYLRIDKLVDAARRAGADAVHPGYGFLSENPDFATALADAGIAFIGPPPAAMAAMGNKLRARALMLEAGVRVIPGSDGAVTDPAEAARLAGEMGYPVMLKAAAGGGGKGMRVVRDPAQLAGALRATREEAGKAFADDAVFVEKYIEKPRHIEIQVMADQHGGCIHLGERECSIQRRHQKVVEESPSPFVTPEMREAMGAMAVQAARAVDYVGAGTVECIVDAARNFYFLEMNTRLQVEHPVTELVTGLDLVEMQLQVAAGERLPLTQEQVSRRGWAMEFRIYAEDPERGFLPSTGKIQRLRLPAGPGLRHDSGIYEKYEVPVYYDPLLSKLVVYGADRTDVIRRARQAFQEYAIAGIKTNIPFHQWLLGQEAFAAGDCDTHFIDERFDPTEIRHDPRVPDVAVLAAVLAAHLHGRRLNFDQAAASDCLPSRWRQTARREAVMRRSQS
ncbi:MAG: acetyl-CoA carboxylase biotin carboxylase subunit [Candidatus Krumholzibacteriia bacterium]|nr:acetyl-CoA carboxylase biotin carboxylase subunit [bacterium]MCB9516976.1 acetyl-CoA carboxylase biotin carboxylase subunit [Candidatus Latescibacterota bacterium]